MTTSTIEFDSPRSSAEMPAFDAGRFEQVSERHAQIVTLMNQYSLDAVLLRDRANFSWVTAGGEPCPSGSGRCVASILVTPEARVVLCHDSNAPWLFDKELAELGFLVKERPWTESPCVLQEDVCRGRQMGIDVPNGNARNLSEELQSLRLSRSDRELQALRIAGKKLTHAVEATARGFSPGDSEREIAGQLSHRLWKQGLEPIQVRICGDGREKRYRTGGNSREAVMRHAVIRAIVRKDGLHLGSTRTVVFGQCDETLIENYQLASFVLATAMRFTQFGFRIEETWRKAARIFEKFGQPDEWRRAPQAEILGYAPQEIVITPQEQRTFPDRSICYWHPNVGGIEVGDSVIARQGGFEKITLSENWPLLSIRSGVDNINVPGILIREVPPGSA